MAVFEKVAEILKSMIGEVEVSSEDSLENDLALDSLALVNLLLDIESEFKIELNEPDLNPFDLITVGDVVELVRKYTGDNYEKVS